MPDPSEAQDREVSRLRSAGRAVARISRDLGMAKSSDAQLAFQRAVRRLPTGERNQVRHAELARLARKVKADTTRSESEQARQLATIDRLRALVG